MREKNGEVRILDRSAFDRYEKSGRLHSWNASTDAERLIQRYGFADIFDVPCGHCINCRLNYARKWSQRCLLEKKCWQDNFFLTLTYDDDHLVYGGDDGLPSLFPFHFTQFLKNMREFYRDKFDHNGIRFYMCGEYGDTTARPHYHMLGFNLPLIDLTYYAKSPLGDAYYNSELLSSIWKKGHVVVGEVTNASAAYVARYVQKKADKKIDYDLLGIHKEYVNMSRRPGIGAPYLEKHWQEIYANDQIYLPGGEIATPPRYFDDKAAAFGVDIESIKQKRLDVANIVNNEKVDMVSKEYYSYLDDLEQSFQKRAKQFRRDKC